MPAGTRPGRVLELIVVTMAGNQYVLYISNSSTAARLHHRVRMLTGILGSFDIIHHTMGAVFGFNKVYTFDLACNASIQVLEASWIVLNASRAVLEASWSPGGVLEPSCSPPSGKPGGADISLPLEDMAPFAFKSFRWERPPWENKALLVLWTWANC